MTIPLSSLPTASAVATTDRVVIVQGTTPAVDRTATVAQVIAAASFIVPIATTSTLGSSQYPSPGGLAVDVSGNVTLNAATSSVIGGVVTGANITNSSGTISIVQAGTATLGVAKFPVAGGLAVSSGSVSVAALAYQQSAPSNPTGTTSLVGVMMGLAGFSTLTPTITGKVLLTISGDFSSSVIGDGGTIQLRYGTGGLGPNNGAALTGTTAGAALSVVVATTASVLPWSRMAIIAGLTPGTAYWFDVSLAAITGGTATVSQIGITAVEVF